jgi:hypothetical protein
LEVNTEVNDIIITAPPRIITPEELEARDRAERQEAEDLKLATEPLTDLSQLKDSRPIEPKHPPLQVALRYAELGWSPVPIKHREKAPRGDEWEKLRIKPVDFKNEERLEHLAWQFNKYANIGVILGEASGGLVDVDLDCREAVALADEFLPATAAVFGRVGKPRSHRLYRVTGACATMAWKHKGEMLLELRGDGGFQTVFPPSVHKDTGEHVEWEESFDGTLPPLVDRAALVASCEALRAAILESRGVAPEQAQENAGLDRKAAGAVDRSPLLFSPDNVAMVTSALAVFSADCSQPEWRDHMFAVSSLVHDDERWEGAVAALFDAWSKGAPSKYDATGNKTQWDAAVRNAKAGRCNRHIESLFFDALAKGWIWVPPAPACAANPLLQFVAFYPDHSYIAIPTGATCSVEGVNAKLPRVGTGMLDAKGKEITIPANQWLDQNRRVDDRAWAPGHPVPIIKDRILRDGGWIDEPGWHTFNSYRPGPKLVGGDPAKAGRWLDHIERIYGPEQARHITQFLAYCLQHPEDKINHALVLCGTPGIGKDWTLEPAISAVGTWNVGDIVPKAITEPTNAYLKSVILRISEAHDRGDMSSFQLYEALKVYCAAPPHTLRVNEKYIRPYSILNVCKVVITTNHRINGLYIPPDDRRMYVAGSEAHKEDFEAGYWDCMWHWYREGGGIAHVAGWLGQPARLEGFDPKAPPPRTEAWQAMVDAARTPEDSEMADAIERMGSCDALTVSLLAGNSQADEGFRLWLNDRKNRRAIPHRLEACGYIAQRNPDQNDGRWWLAGKNHVVYVKTALSPRERLDAVRRLQERLPSDLSRCLLAT